MQEEKCLEQTEINLLNQKLITIQKKNYESKLKKAQNFRMMLKE